MYYLEALIAIALVFSLFGKMNFGPLQFIFSFFFILFVCWGTNELFSRLFKVTANVESFYITAFILVLIISPLKTWTDIFYYTIAFWGSFMAMASKYLITIKKRHIFNPAAFGVTIVTLVFKTSATWWIGNKLLMPFVLIGGLLIVRKILRSDLVWSFFFTAFMTMLASFLPYQNFGAIWQIVQSIIFSTPILFFAFIMVTEPFTTPTRINWQMVYGTLVGFLFAPAIHIGSLYSTPELALLVGNIFSYFVSSKERLILTLKEKIKISPDIYDFIFTTPQKIQFLPGQYLEWTLAVNKPDLRGNRRYFTLASAPSEMEKNQEMRLGVKFYDKPSTFKRDLRDLPIGGTIFAGSLSGEFVLPRDKNKKLVFIAGGIGVTPYRAILKQMIDTGEKRDIVILNSVKTREDIVYDEIFKQAESLGVKTIHIVNNLKDGTQESNMRAGILSAEMIQKEIPDYRDRTFYISGPHGMVTAFENLLKGMGVSDIKTDFFPGFV